MGNTPWEWETGSDLAACKERIDFLSTATVSDLEDVHSAGLFGQARPFLNAQEKWEEEYGSLIKDQMDTLIRAMCRITPENLLLGRPIEENSPRQEDKEKDNEEE